MSAGQDAEQRLRRNLARGTLKSVLEAVNGSEGLESPRLQSAARTLLFSFKNYIGELDEFGDNEKLRFFDRAFQDAGWDDQGLRWTSETPGEPDDIFIVEFHDSSHDKWSIT